MSNTPHTLTEEFPAQLDKMHALKASDPQFARLMAEYDVVNDRVHRAETRLDAVTQDHEESLRRQRARIKDSIAARLRD